MFTHSATFGLIAAAALVLPPGADPGFTLAANGAVDLTVAGTEAQYGMAPERVEGHQLLAISLGTTAGGAVVLYTSGDELPRPGRYPIRASWADEGTKGRGFHLCFVAGTPAHPLGAFHGQSGWVTITGVENGTISGTFAVQARGYLAASIEDDNRWVTVRGGFVAAGDSTTASLAGL